MPYVTRAKAGWVEDDLWSSDTGTVPDLRVDGPTHVNTGLVSAEGHAIYRTQPPIGFGRDAEW